MNNPNVHHDALEFPDGRVILLQQLEPGQEATVLQLPNAHASERDSSGEELRLDVAAPSIQPVP